MTSSEGADCSAILKERECSTDCELAALFTLHVCCTRHDTLIHHNQLCQRCNAAISLHHAVIRDLN